MDGGAIRTERLTLRPLQPADAPAVTAGLQDWAVMQWLTAPPWPFTLKDAEEFIAGPGSAGSMAIIADGRFAGTVHIAADRELGYWLAPAFHGQGIMTEAAAARIDGYFHGSDDPIHSGYVAGNAPSARVLEKLGFRPDGIRQQAHRARGEVVEVRRMLLTAADWRARCG